MSTVLLNKREVALLKSAARKGDDNAHFQEILVRLDKLVNDRTGQIQIPPDLMELIHKYGADVGKLSWRGTLFSIFGRTMGGSFGQHPETCTELIDIDKKPEKKTGHESDRNWRAL